MTCGDDPGAQAPGPPLTSTDHSRNARRRRATEGLSGRRFLADRTGDGTRGVSRGGSHAQHTCPCGRRRRGRRPGVAAPAAVADGGRVPHPSNIVALPSVIARGGQLTITVDGCPNGGTATSNAFPRTNLTPINGANDTSKGTATIDHDARPGPYDITVHCSGRSLTRPAAFTVIGGVRGRHRRQQHQRGDADRHGDRRVAGGRRGPRQRHLLDAPPRGEAGLSPPSASVPRFARVRRPRPGRPRVSGARSCAHRVGEGPLQIHPGGWPPWPAGSASARRSAAAAW